MFVVELINGVTDLDDEVAKILRRSPKPVYLPLCIMIPRKLLHIGPH